MDRFQFANRKGEKPVTILYFAAGALAFAVAAVFGKKYIPWLVENKFIQPLKDEVEEKIYSEQGRDADKK